LQCVAVCCIVLQCVAVCCSVLHVLQCVVLCCSVLQCVAMIDILAKARGGISHCSTLNTLQHTATLCNTLQHAATRCTHSATPCKILQHTATHINDILAKASGRTRQLEPHERATLLIAIHCTALQHTRNTPQYTRNTRATASGRPLETHECAT